MLCPPGRVNASDQPLTAADPVLVTVMLSVSPVFQALTVSVTRQPPGPPVVGGGLVGGFDVGGAVVGGAVVGGAVVGGVLAPSRPRKAMEYASMPACGRVCPVPAMLTPSTVACVPVLP